MTGVNTLKGTTGVNGGTLSLSGAGSVASTMIDVTAGELQTDGDAFTGTPIVTVAEGTTLTLNGDATILTLTNNGTVNAAAISTGVVTNSGRFASGGQGVVATTTILGDFTQTDAGVLDFDIDGGNGTADLIAITGVANLTGRVDVAGTGMTPLGTTTVLTATEGAIDNGLTVGGTTGFANPLAQAELVFPDADTLAIQFAIDTESRDLNPNQVNAVNSLNSAGALGGGGVSDLVTAVFDLPDAASTAVLLDQLGAESFLNLQTTSLFAAQGFGNSLLNCGADTPFSVATEGRCI